MAEPNPASRAMVDDDDDDYDSEVEEEEVPKFELKVNHEAKLKELLHKINSLEIKLYSDATKEFIKLLKGNSGGEFLRYYIRSSSRCLELLDAWKLRRGKPGMSYIFKLVSVILSHPDGMYRPNDKEGLAISRVLDKFARLVIDEQLQDVYKELSSRETKSQNAALQLMASIVRRGSGLASDVAKNFDFKLKGFSKLAEFKKKKQNEKRVKRSSRKAFVGFAMSFLEVGKPGLLRWVLQQKEMYSGVLRGLGNDDDDDTIIYVLSTLRDRILVEESLVPPGLRSVLFGSSTLEQLVNISGRENGESAAELAYSVLVSVCTDPCNGLMPDLTRHPSPLRGNPKRLLGLMKKLKATDSVYHRDLLLAIVSGRPSFGAAYMEEFPYNLEDYASPNWFAIVTLAANLVVSVGKGHKFDFLASQPHDPPSSDSEYLQSVMKCLCPRSFSRSVINKGLLHSDFLVKHGTLRLLLEALKLLDSLFGAINSQSSSPSGEVVQGWASLKQEIQNEVRTLLPDPQVLLSLLSSLSSQSKTRENSLKRKADLGNFPQHGSNSAKKFKRDNVNNKDSDIIVGGINFFTDPAEFEDSERVDSTPTADEFDAGKDIVKVLLEVWGPDLCNMTPFAIKDVEIYFQSKLLDALKTYFRIMPTVLEGSFDFLINLLTDPLALHTNLQHSILSLLIEYIGWSPSAPTLMYKHLQSFMNLLIFSPINDIKNQAYDLAQAAMLSTGAFDRNHHEIGSWFLFLPGYDRRHSSFHIQGVEVLQSLCQVVISFLCDAISTVGNNLFKYWDVVKRHTCNLEGLKGLSPDFSPVVVCILQKCLRLLDSESGTFTLPEKSMISLYVGDTIKYILQTQVDTRLPSAVVDSILFERLGEHSSVSDDSSAAFCEWRPLKNLFLFSRCISNQQTCVFSIDQKSIPTVSSFGIKLDEVKRLLSSGNDGEIAGLTEVVSSSIICTISEDVLKQAPFHVLFLSIMSIDGPYSLGPKNKKALLLAKLSEWKFDSCFVSYLRLLLFWIHQIQLSYRVSPLAKFLELSEICFILLKDLLAQLLDLNTDLDCYRASRLHLSSQEIQDVAETIFCHPAVVTSLSRPLSCEVDLAKANLADNMDTLINISKQSVHKLDHHVLDMLATAYEYFLSPCNGHHFNAKLKNGIDKELMKVLNVPILRIIEEVKDRLTVCVCTQNLMLLLQPYYTLHVIMQFIAPFQLLDLVQLMFKRVYMDTSIVWKPDRTSAISFGCCIAAGAFRNLSSYFMQPLSKKRKYDIFWEMEGDKNVKNVEEIYVQVTELALYIKTDYADLCLLEAVNAARRQKYVQHHNFHRSCLVLSRIIMKTSVKILSHCIYGTTKTRAKLLFLLTDMSSLHLSIFGHLFLSIVNKDLLYKGNKVDELPDLVPSDEDFMMLLPAALSYLNSTSMKFGMQYYKHLRIIPSFYSKILLKSFVRWKSFVSGDIFQEEYGEFVPSSIEELLSLVNDSLLGKAIRMLQYHLAFDEDSVKIKKRLKLFNSIFPVSAANDELIGSDFGEIDSYSLKQSLNFINRVTAKISICRLLLFPNRDQIQCQQKEEGSRMYLINILVSIWQLIVKKFPSVSDSFQKSTDVLSLYRYLEEFILRSILELTTNMRGTLIHLESIPFLEKLMKSALRYRFEDPTTLKMLQGILTLLSEGKFSRDFYLQLLLAHSQFEPTIQSVTNSTNCSLLGAFLRPLPGVLRYLVFHRTGNNASDGNYYMKTAGLYSKQLEVIKLLRTLLPSKSHQSAYDFGKSLGIKFRKLHLLLLSSYGSKLSKIDMEIYNLMLAIESIDGVEAENISGVDYLWGSAASKIEKERALEHDTSNVVNDAEAVKERRRSQFRENLPIDPKICASTVLYYPYNRIASHEAASLENLQSDNFTPVLMNYAQTHSPDDGNLERYDPVFILRFSLNSLSVGYIEAMEFAGLGLLAIAFVSLSSPDDGIRRLAYSVLGKFKNALEQCKKRKDVTRIRLLLISLQNGIEEPWQRVPSIVAIFSAEASFILLDPSHDHYATLSRLLMNSFKLNMKNVPLFKDFFWSTSVNFRAERLWILRLLYVGLNLDDDAQIYIRNSILETLMSFHFSPLSDHESKDLILQVVKKSIKSYKMTRHLVENCGLFSWLSSVLLISSRMNSREEKNIFIMQLTVVLKVVNDITSSRNVSEWLQKKALEQLMELTSHLFRFLVDGMILSKEKLSSFLQWAISSALQSESAIVRQSKVSQHCLSVISEEEQSEDSLVSKLLRWLTASVILGKLAIKSKVLDPKIGSTLKDLLCSFEPAETECEESREDRSNCDEFLASTILHLQLLVGTNYKVLPSVISALSVLLENALSRADVHNNGLRILLESLWSKICCPVEANPAWRWSFYQPWKDLSLESTDLQKIDELHACQTLLHIMATALGSMQPEWLQSMVHDLQRIDAFEWEKGILETD
ncbi:Nucleolar pre-ribosomal-associated protein [Parasponia andersonii]|uniref:Nucleolar pre-ribosomal-associated protein n=1 Tax=Parasponia andersonii TaxID=3476 RepID=A0A2P5BRT9_PARAD|nr:Nucleolar pre-ribosomal-associated protein [Parasponia andersonii]